MRSHPVAGRGRHDDRHRPGPHPFASRRLRFGVYESRSLIRASLTA